MARHELRSWTAIAHSHPRLRAVAARDFAFTFTSGTSAPPEVMLEI